MNDANFTCDLIIISQSKYSQWLNRKNVQTDDGSINAFLFAYMSKTGKKVVQYFSVCDADPTLQLCAHFSLVRSRSWENLPFPQYINLEIFHMLGTQNAFSLLSWAIFGREYHRQPCQQLNFWQKAPSIAWGVVHASSLISEMQRRFEFYAFLIKWKKHWGTERSCPTASLLSARSFTSAIESDANQI